MKKHRLKKYLKFGILLIGITIFFFTCEKDIEHEENLESQDSNLFSKIDFTTFKDKVKDENIESLDINKLVNRQTISLGELQYRTESENFVISIDSTDVLTAEKDGITSYTFKTQTTDNSKTTNYILAHDENNNTDEYYLTYENDGSSKVIDPSNGYEVTTQSRGSVWCPITEEQLVCTCAGHTADQCGGCSGWETVTVVIGNEYCGPSLGEGSGGGSGDGNGDGEGTGGGSGDGNDGGNDLPIDGPIITKPVKELESEEEIIRKRECKKIKKIINDLNPDFMTKLRDLKNKDDLNFESGVAVFEDDLVQDYQGSEEISTIQNYPVAPTSDYISVGHVHNETNDIKTYSVFSLQDLEWVARKYEQGYLNTSEFVTFLATADGNYLALTINSASKFWEFFRYIDAAYPSATVQQRQEAATKLNEVSPTLNKYYKSLTNPLIKENAQGTTNNRYQLRYFMQFLEEANAGVTVFETNENFDSFSELVLNGTNVVGNEIPCEL